MPDATILGIESSCDETGAAVVRSGQQILSNVVASQIATHQPYGGIVPELASREHCARLFPLSVRRWRKPDESYESVDAIAVTQGPGLAGALLVGISFAKALSFALESPHCRQPSRRAHSCRAARAAPGRKCGPSVSGARLSRFRRPHPSLSRQGRSRPKLARTAIFNL